MRLRVLMKVAIFFGFLGMSVGGYSDEFSAGFIAAEKGNYDEAIKQWTPLAKQGHADAQFNLALILHSGSVGQVDEKQAVILYHQAAANGYRLAQEYLAIGYQEGWFGLKKDAKQAAYWLAKSAQQ